MAAAAVASAALSFPSSKFPKCPSPPLLSRRSGHRPCCLSVDRPDASASASASSAGSGIRVVFAGGGTGGHIYPAIAIADELKNTCPGAEVLFLGSDDGIEREAVPAAGHAFAPVPTPRRSDPLPLLPFRLLRATAASWAVLRNFRPQLVVGTGGYVAFPACLVAVLSGTPLVIQEQNSFPGLTNRAFAPFARKIFLAFNAPVRHLPKHKCVVCGNPIRLSLRRYVSKAVARSHFFPQAGKHGDEKAQVVLVLGGSGGANTINITVLNLYYDMLMENKNRYIIWQTGAAKYDEMESIVRNHPRLLLTPFLHAMDLAYAAADVVVSRAGAMTCTEILTTGKPSILIPLPTAPDDHQTRNAYIMAEVAGSKVLEEDELDSSSLQTAIDEVLGNENLMAEMSKKALTVARPNASADIVRHILSLIKIPSQ